IATVDEYGHVTAHSLGQSYITARCGDISSNCRILVVETPVEQIFLNTESAELKVGEEIRLDAYVVPEEATDKTVTWSSEDYSIASVDEFGNVTAQSIGETVITASCGSVSASCMIIVEPVLAEVLEIDPSYWYGEIGSHFHISVNVLPENATDKNVVFESTDMSVATVDSEGNVEIKGEGTCSITVSTVDGSGLYLECLITGISDVMELFENTGIVVDIYNMEGILILHQCSSEDIKRLKPGMYIIRTGQTSKTVYIKNKF
ncbi:MAG: Ig-like domain-containing protein, partial [Muribaculaceae bacterium]|nr:Ig-like domain-containing protein [Muribaculaceae bacterium]